MPLTATDILAIWRERTPTAVRDLAREADRKSTLFEQAICLLAASYLEAYLDDDVLLETLATDIADEIDDGRTDDVTADDLVATLVHNAREHATADVEYFQDDFRDRANADLHFIRA